MRCLKRISILTVLSLLFTTFPATVAEDGIIIETEEPTGEELEIGAEWEVLKKLDEFDDSVLILKDVRLEFDVQEDENLISETEEQSEVFVESNESGDFEIDEDGVLTRYRGFAKNVVIPDRVKEIGYDAFSDASFIESVSIPNSVTYIGSSAFSGCTGLKTITLPNSVTETGSDVLSGCSGLTSVQLSKNLSKLSSSFFEGCSSLKTIALPSGIKEIESRAFSSCSSLKNITLPDGITRIEEYAFRYCDGLESIVIPSTVVSIDREAFYSSDNVIVRGIEGSYAERYANNMGIPFNAPIVSLDEHTEWVYEYGEEFVALILYINQSHSLNANQKPTDLARSLAWSSSNTNVVSVDQNGKIKGISQGTATITVNTADGKGRAAQIKVLVPESTSIEINYYGDEEVILNQTSIISASIDIPYQYETKVEMPITWSSSDSSIISVEATEDNKATLKGNKLGKATIIATTPDGGRASFELEVVRPEVESIKIDQTGPITLYPGERFRLTTTLFPEYSESQLTWYSDDTDIATVSNDGIVTAIAEGETWINVYTTNEENGCEAYIKVRVMTPPKKITLSKTKATLATGDTLTIKAKITPENAETNFTWSSSKPSVAEVSQKGKVTALKAGMAKITVSTDNGKTASATITVKPAPKKVKLNKSKATLGVKEKLTLAATLSPSNAYTSLTWKSSKPAVAAVSKKGVITPKKPGTAVITVKTSNGKTAKATVTVKAAPKKVTLNKTGTVELKEGKRLKLKATLPANTASALTWKSSKPKVARVDKNGVVTALKKGTATITVKTFNGKTAKVKISVIK